ncbi:hypothetical protein JCM5353_004768 [Sporobolomyces roseus]
MTVPQRPPPPLRSYTETVQADVSDAVAESFLSLSVNNPPTTSVQTTPTTNETTPRRKRAPTLGNGDHLRRRRSNDEIRLPPNMNQDALDDNDETPSASRNPSPTRRTLSGIVGVRRSNSTDLLVLANDVELEDSNSDEGFSSEEEPFRFRPPSITSTTTSQHSSRRGIRVEDASNRDNNIFVKQLSIPTYHAVGSEGSGFVVFDIEIQTLPTSSSQGTLIRTHKRYSAFVRLRADLIEEFPRLRRVLPRLPPKSSLGEHPLVSLLIRSHIDRSVSE